MSEFLLELQVHVRAPRCGSSPPRTRSGGGTPRPEWEEARWARETTASFSLSTIDRVGLVGERRGSSEVAQVEATGIETALVGGGDGDDRQLLVEGQLLEALDDAARAVALVASLPADRHLLHVVDEQCDRLILEASGSSDRCRDAVCGPDPVTKTRRSP